MPINTKHVKNRRQLRFHSLDDILADARALAASPNTRTLGNWPLPQLLAHLGTSINNSIDGIHFRVPFFIRIFGFLAKRHVLTRGISPGFNLPKSRVPDSFPNLPTKDAALQLLQSAIQRTRTEKMAVPHPVFGKLTPDQWTQFHLRHAELHLSFARMD